jgi:hypothetical protein
MCSALPEARCRWAVEPPPIGVLTAPRAAINGFAGLIPGAALRQILNFSSMK